MYFKNPIFSMELKLKMKNVSLPVFLTLYNLFFAFISIISLISFSDSVNSGWDGALLDLISVFYFLGMLQCFLIFVFAPIFTADMIVGERKRGTLDLLLSSPISPFSIVIGKLSTTIFIMLLFSLSSLPILSAGFLYGGIGIRQLLGFFFVLFTNAFLCGAIGIFCSSISKGRIMSILLSSLIEFFLTIGNFYAIVFFRNAIDGNMAVSREVIGSLLFINPFMSIISLYDSLAGTNNKMYALMQFFSISQNSASYAVLEHIFLPINSMIQILLGILFIHFTVKIIMKKVSQTSTFPKLL